MGNRLARIVPLVGGVAQAQFPPSVPNNWRHPRAAGAGRDCSGASISGYLDKSGHHSQATAGGSDAMRTRLFPTLLGAGIGLALVALPARAADIEATAQLCAACHGQNGMPSDPKTVPIIWGQERAYLFKQMRNYRNGEREHPIMSPLAKGLAEEDLRPLAAYYAAKPWPARSAFAAPGPLPKGITQCQACHQPNFQGGPPAPRLAGLSYEYLVASMSSFADDARTNNLDMPMFMRMLTDTERDAIARYLSNL